MALTNLFHISKLVFCFSYSHLKHSPRAPCQARDQFLGKETTSNQNNMTKRKVDNFGGEPYSIYFFFAIIRLKMPSF